jgi:hypothetical protein
VTLVTVSAQDFAFRNLQAKTSNGDAKVHHIADIARLCGCGQMIEFQDDRVVFATLHARVVALKLSDKCPNRIALARIVALIPLQVRRLIVLIVLLRDSRGAHTAERMTGARAAVLERERFGGMDDTASSAKLLDGPHTSV